MAGAADSDFYRDCLRGEFERRCERNPRYSLRAFARALGFEATIISQILSARRVPSLRTAERLAAALGLAPDARARFLESLGETHRARGLERLNPFFKQTGATDRRSGPDLSLDLFRAMADWQHYAILALTQTEGARGVAARDLARVAAAELGLTQTQAKLAIERLKNLELLVERPDGALTSRHDGFTTADKAVTTPALRQHQRQMLEKAIDSLENDPIDVRGMLSMTFAIDPSRLGEARRKMQRFIDEMTDSLTSGRQARVYQLNVALFPLQKVAGVSKTSSKGRKAK